MPKPEQKPETPPAPRLHFRKAVREMMRDHRSMAGRVLFIDPVTHETHGTLRARLRGLVHGPFRARLKEAFEAAAKTQAPVADIIHTKSVDAVLVTPGRQAPGAALFELHRQAARIVAERGAGQNKYFDALFDIPYAAHTATADAYAAIRFLRGPQADAEFLKNLSLQRARDFVTTGNAEQLSSFVIDKIAADRDFSKVKRAELVEVADLYMRGFTPTRAESDALVKEFAPLKGKPLDDAGLRTLAEITGASKNPLAKRLGGKILAAAGVEPVKQAVPAGKPKTL